MVFALVLLVWTVLGFGAAILFGRVIRLGGETECAPLYLDRDERNDDHSRYAA